MRLDEKIAAIRERLAGDETRKALIQRAQAEGTSQPVLLQLVRAARQRGPEDAVVRRLDTPFVRRMLGLLKKRNEWVNRYGEEAREREAELSATHKRLRESYNLDPAAEPARPCAEGMFSGGVRLHVEELALEGLNGCVFKAPDSGKNCVAYAMQEGVVSLVPAE